MNLLTRIRKANAENPHWSAARIAEEIGTTPKTVSVVASRNKIKFLSRRQLEEIIDGEAFRLREEAQRLLSDADGSCPAAAPSPEAEHPVC